MKRFRKGTTDTFEIQGKSISGLFGYFDLIASAVNNAITADDVDETKVRLTAKLSRPGKNIKTLFSQQLDILSAFASPYTSMRYGFDVTKAPAPGVYASINVPWYLDLVTTINLKGPEKLIVEIHIADDVFSANIDTSTSEFGIEALPEMGYAEGIPIIETRNVTDVRTEMVESLGDDVKKLVFVTRSADTLADGEILQSIRVDSDKLNFDQTAEELQVLKRLQSTSVDDDFLTNQTAIIFDVDVPLDDCNIHADFSAANVETSENYLVFCRLEQDADVIRRTAYYAEKHESKAISKAQNVIQNG